jgi:hypothetical protein
VEAVELSDAGKINVQLVAELREFGVQAKKIYTLVNQEEPYPAAIPILKK